MKTRIVPMAAAGLLSLSALTHAEAPKLTSEAFRAKLKQDTTGLPAGGQMQMSYAPVVDKVLPTVVRVVSYSKGSEGAGGMEDLFGGGGGGRNREALKEWFRQFGLPVPEGDDFGSDEDSPRGRRGAPRRGNEEEQEPNDDAKKKAGVGSGVIISPDGYILTNNHVVEDADRLEVIVGNSTKALAAKVIGADKLTDVALIKIEGANLPFATLSDSDKLRVGDIVLAAGSPMELSQSVSQGIVSALGRTGMGIVNANMNRSMLPGFENFIQTDAAINPGNSGGPLVDALGRVVGINTAIFTRSGMNSGIGFSIPINLALRIAEDLADDGEVRRGFLGVRMEDLTGDRAKNVGLDDGGGVMVVSVTKGSAAEDAKIEAGDIIISANGQRTEGSMALRSIIGGARVGAVMPLEIIRDGNRQTVSVTLKGATDQELFASSKGGAGPKEEIAKGKPIPAEIIPGVTCGDITPGYRERYEIPADVQGVVVLRVEANTAAASVGLEEGDVILTINQKPIRNMADATANKPKASTAMIKVNRAGERLSMVIEEK
jgi:Do/DeqQ family serine protease